MKRSKLLSLFLILPAFVAGILPVSANSAVNEWWTGTTSGNVISMSGDCPIMVTEENLTFYPDSEYSGGYGSNNVGHLEAAYTLYNPSDSDITACLLFPFETGSSYGEEEIDESLCSVMKDETDVAMEIHTVYGDSQNFDLNQYLSCFSLNCLSNENYSKDTHVYTYTLSFETSHTENDVYITYDGPEFGADGHGILGSFSDFNHYDDSIYDIKKSNGSTYVVSFIGSDMLDQYLNHLSFSCWVNNEKTETDGKLTYTECKESTLYDFFMDWTNEWNEGIDWFNLCFSAFQLDYSTNVDYIKYMIFQNTLNTIYYTFDVKSKETVVNTVKVPLYPSVNRNYDPYKFSFTYLLTPASTWGSFCNLNINIVTDMAISNASMDFEETKNGYHFHSDTLPKSDLSFVLCESSNPDYEKDDIGSLVFDIFIIILYILCFGVAFLIPIIVEGKSKVYISDNEEKHWLLNAIESGIMLLFMIALIVFTLMWQISVALDVILSIAFFGTVIGFEIARIIKRGKINFWPFVPYILVLLVILLYFIIFNLDTIMFSYYVILPLMNIYLLIDAKKIEKKPASEQEEQNMDDTDFMK